MRAALGEALAEAIGSPDAFDPAALDANAIRIAILRFVAELVFVSVMTDSGKALAAVSPPIAVQRENDLRNLIREVTDVVGTPLLNTGGTNLSTPAVQNLVARLVREVHQEMGSWE
ncbi:MAG TPA: hypothetical protein VK557_05845 [Pyrinomonadaceae bacterium]|nr:hypothetical protein [Pyrinomonadaceae bacterium]